MKPLSTQEQRETIQALLTFVKSIAPKLQDVAKNREFELVITNDKDGISLSCSMGWDPTLDDAEVHETPCNKGLSEKATAKLRKKARKLMKLSNALFKENDAILEEIAAQLGISVAELEKRVSENAKK